MIRIPNWYKSYFECNIAFPQCFASTLVTGRVFSSHFIIMTGDTPHFTTFACTYTVLCAVCMNAFTPSFTNWGRDKMVAISQTIFSNKYFSNKVFEFRLTFHWTLFLRVQLTIFQHLVQIMAWRPPGDKPLSEPMMVWLPMHICVIRPQWVNTLRPKNMTRILQMTFST